MKKRVCIYMYMRVVLINILVPQLDPPKQKFLTPPQWAIMPHHQYLFPIIFSFYLIYIYIYIYE